MQNAAAALAERDRGGGSTLTAFKAPLLERILTTADPERRQVVLDLGAPSQMLLDRLSTTRPCRIEVADILPNHGLAVLNAEATLEAADGGPIRKLLPEANGEPLDLVLLWDLPNYLGLKALAGLCDVLAERAAPGCRLHMLIAYSRRDMPLAPARYIPQADGQLAQHCGDSRTTAAPRYSPEDLGIAMGRFGYERGVLLANGMQEFVYAWPS